MSKYKEYIVYNVKNDDVLAIGDAEECARQLGYKNKEVFYTKYGQQKLRIARGKNIKVMIYEIEEEDE